MTLLGMPLDEAIQILKKNGYDCEAIAYLGKRPYSNADIARVVRQKKLQGKKYQLVYSYFISVPATNSQDCEVLG